MKHGDVLATCPPQSAASCVAPPAHQRRQDCGGMPCCATNRRVGCRPYRPKPGALAHKREILCSSEIGFPVFMTRSVRLELRLGQAWERPRRKREGGGTGVPAWVPGPTG